MVSKSLPLIQASVKWSVGDGKNINFWLDCWLDSSVVDQLNFPAGHYGLLNARVSDFIRDGVWNLPQDLCENGLGVTDAIKKVVIPIAAEAKDHLV